MRAADVWAEQPCELLRLPAAAFRSLGLSSEGLAEHARTALRVHLRGSVPTRADAAGAAAHYPARLRRKAPGVGCTTHSGGAPQSPSPQVAAAARGGGAAFRYLPSARYLPPQWRQMELSSAGQFQRPNVAHAVPLSTQAGRSEARGHAAARCCLSRRAGATYRATYRTSAG